MFSIIGFLIILATAVWQFRREAIPWSWWTCTIGFMSAVVLSKLVDLAFAFAYPR